MNFFASLARPILDQLPDLASDDLQFAPAPNLEAGDVALRTFVAAKKLGIAPPALAKQVMEEVSFGPEVTGIEVSGPYVNFRLDRGRLARTVTADIFARNGRYGSTSVGAGHKLLIEHTSINPNASPHVGRARNAIYGDTLARLFRFEGYDVDVHYYVNDIGRQIGLLVLYCEDLLGMTFDDVLEAYVAANAKADADVAFSNAGYELLAKMEEGDSETAARFRAVVDLCLKGQLAVLERLGISYDSFDYESNFLDSAVLDRVIASLEQRGAVFTDEEQRLVVDLQKLGHEREEGRYFVLRRANGSSMYGFRDLAYNAYKANVGADVNIQVFGEDHKLYAEQLAMILNAAGVAVPETVYYSYVLLKEGKMSTRQGKVVLLSEFLDEATRRARLIVDEQCQDLPESERADVAREVALAAVRFSVLKINPNKNVTFEWESNLTFNGATGPYVQYTCARAHSVLRRYAEEFGRPAEMPAEDFPTETVSEWDLVSKLAAFEDVVANALAERNPAPIARYALDAAGSFNTFYHECPVLRAESEQLRAARAQLCKATAQVLTNALGILGITALDRM